MVEWKKPGAPSDAAEFELYDYDTAPLETQIRPQRPSRRLQETRQ